MPVKPVPGSADRPPADTSGSKKLTPLDTRRPAGVFVFSAEPRKLGLEASPCIASNPEEASKPVVALKPAFAFKLSPCEPFTVFPSPRRPDPEYSEPGPTVPGRRASRPARTGLAKEMPKSCPDPESLWLLFKLFSAIAVMEREFASSS